MDKRSREVPVVTAVPMPVPAVPSNPLGGTEWLSNLPGLFIRQRLEVLEALSGCETKNKYEIVALAEPPPQTVGSDYTRGLRAQAGMRPLLKAKEESECFERICCPLFRGFNMNFTDGQGTSYFSLDRPFVCEPFGCWPCFSTVEQNLSLSSGGRVLFKAREPVYKCDWSCCVCSDAGCTRNFVVEDTSGKQVYELHAAECGTHSGGSNCCAPTCFNESYDVDVFGPDGEFQNSSSFVWPGCNCGGLTDRSNIVANFASSATPDERAALVAGLMLVEYTVMEKRRQQDNNGGGGGGG